LLFPVSIDFVNVLQFLKNETAALSASYKKPSLQTSFEAEAKAATQKTAKQTQHKKND
jgi:hypothetical protein